MKYRDLPMGKSCRGPNDGMLNLFILSKMSANNALLVDTVPELVPQARAVLVNLLFENRPISPDAEVVALQ